MQIYFKYLQNNKISKKLVVKFETKMGDCKQVL